MVGNLTHRGTRCPHHKLCVLATPQGWIQKYNMYIIRLGYTNVKQFPCIILNIRPYMFLAKSFSSLVVINAIVAPLLATEQDPLVTP